MDLNNLPWAAISGVIAILTLGISLIKTFFANSRQLSFEIKFNSQLINKELLRKDIKYVHNNKNLTTLILLEIHLMNTGRKPITKSEFDSPIAILLDENAKIISFEVDKCYPKNLPVKLQANKNEVLVEPLLLNSNNLISIQLLITGVEKILPQINFRIEGIDNVEPILRPKSRINYTAIAFLILTSDFLYIYITGNFKDDLVTLTEWTAIPIILAFVLVAIGTIVNQRRENRYYRYTKYLAKSY